MDESRISFIYSLDGRIPLKSCDVVGEAMKLPLKAVETGGEYSAVIFTCKWSFPPGLLAKDTSYLKTP
jgi:hypothetical protein